MTPEEIEKLKQLCNEATPGPWVVDVAGGGCAVISGPAPGLIVPWVLYGQTPLNNNSFIAASRTAVPALIAEVERLQSELDKYKKLYNEAYLEGYDDGRSCSTGGGE